MEGHQSDGDEQTERLARWLYDRDKEWLNRVSWDSDNDGLRNVYRAEARAAIDYIGAHRA